jgi:hypothetical protein
MVTQMRKLIISLAIVLLTSFPAYANILHIKSESDRPTIERLIAAWYEDVQFIVDILIYILVQKSG